MAATVANTRIVASEYGSKLLYTEITLDSSYAAGGESITASQFGLFKIDAIFPAAASGYILEPVRSSDTTWLLKIWARSLATTSASVIEESNIGRDLSAVVIRTLIMGL